MGSGWLGGIGLGQGGWGMGDLVLGGRWSQGSFLHESEAIAVFVIKAVFSEQFNPDGFP